MAVEVRLFTTLRDYYPDDVVDGVFQYELKGEKTVRDLAQELNLPFAHIHLIMVNGEQGDLDYKLKDGDRIGFFPPVGGG